MFSFNVLFLPHNYFHRALPMFHRMHELFFTREIFILPCPIVLQLMHNWIFYTLRITVIDPKILQAMTNNVNK